MDLKCVGKVKIIATKRLHDTPKEVNQYLRKNKKKTIKEISKETNLPKTQIEHYFRTDRSRAVPSPKDWIQLKQIMDLDDTMDKIIMQTYKKEVKYEMNRRVYDSMGIHPTLESGTLPYILVYMPTSSTNTQHKFMKGTLMTDQTQGTSQQSQQKKYQTTNYWLGGSLAKLSALLVKEEDSKILEELSSLKLLESPNKSNHAFYYLKTLKGYYHTTKAKHLELSSTRFQNWGMTASGKCLTAKISVSPKTEKGCSLSDILEEQVNQKYFLSEQVTERMLKELKERE